MSAVASGDTGGYTFFCFDACGEGRSEAGGILLGHGPKMQMVGAILSQREADEAASKFRHEIDGLGRYEIRSKGEIALVLAIFVVYHHDHAPAREFIQRFRDSDKGRRHSCSILHAASVRSHFRPPRYRDPEPARGVEPL